MKDVQPRPSWMSQWQALVRRAWKQIFRGNWSCGTRALSGTHAEDPHRQCHL